MLIFEEIVEKVSKEPMTQLVHLNSTSLHSLAVKSHFKWP